MARKNDQLRDEVARAVLAEVERVGPEFDRSALVGKFQNRGVDRATLFRWVAAELASGRPGQHLVRKVKATVARQAKQGKDPAKEAAAEALTKLPAVISGTDLLPGAAGAVAVIEKLQSCIRIAEKVIAHAQTAEGAVRNARLLLQGSEHLRRTIDSCVRLQEAAMEVAQVDAFHREIFKALEEEAPEVAHRVLMRLDQIGAAWEGKV